MAVYTENLREIIFSTHSVLQACDSFVIISGYIGPNPIRELMELPVKCDVIYGMYGIDGINERLHKSLIGLESADLNILYSEMAVHTKCYIWLNKGEIVKGMSGSANFSDNSLNIDNKEMLIEIDSKDFSVLKEYISLVRSNAINCTSDEVKIIRRLGEERKVNTAMSIFTVRLELYNPRTGKVQDKHGLNWGYSTGNVVPGDACIAIRSKHLDEVPLLFPPKPLIRTTAGGKSQRENDPIEVIWDDGVIMSCILEGTQRKIYPKNFTSAKTKGELGKYFRDRLGIKKIRKITMEDLESYGRTDIELTYIAPGVYTADFSVPKKM